MDDSTNEVQDSTNNDTAKKWVVGLGAAAILGGGALLLTRPSSTDTTTTNGIKSGSNQCQYSCSGPDRDCSDFSTHAKAQAFFDCCGFTATNDPMKLDSIGVGNGVACESLP